MTQVKAWIARCKELHTICCLSGGPPSLNGLRVIDCAQLQVVEAPPGYQYVALSYVWGKQDTEVLLQGFETRVNMPRTIPGAVKVEFELGYVGRSLCKSGQHLKDTD